MIKLFGTTRRKRIISFFLLITIVSEIVTPTATFALTGGPSQPEVQAFTPVSTAEMVDLTSGDFKYNIPLMDVGGYPLNIAYNSGIGMDDEASWTGLGWNLNVGSINRNMRGLPDDFNGEVIEKELNMKDNTTYGVNVGVGIELFGGVKNSDGNNGNSPGKLNVGLGINYNNYTGIGMEQTANIGISAGDKSKGSMNAGLGMKSSNSGGLTLSPNLSFSAKTDNKQKDDATTFGSASIGIGMSVNSRAGLKDLSVNAGYKRNRQKECQYKGETVSLDRSGGTGSAGVINFGASTYVPFIQNSMVNNSVALSFKLGTTVFGLDGDITIGGYFANQSIMNPYTSTAAYGYMFSHVGQESDNVLMDFNREKDQSFSRYTKNLPITNQTYDVFSVTGQGIGGAFRPFRSDVGYVFDNKSTNTSDSYSAGGEFAGAQTAHLGVDISVVDVNTVSGKWKDDNMAKGRLMAHDATTNKDYEPYYFREVGEKSSDDVQNTLFTSLGGDEAYRIKIDKLVDHRATDVLENSESGIPLPVPATNYIQQRQKRNQVMSTLNLEDAKSYGFDKAIYDPAVSHPAGMDISASARPHHIAEITTLRTDGSRYIYGLPAYNTQQEEISFNASATANATNQTTVTPHPGYDAATGYVSYGANDISTSNQNGIDHYYSRVKMPAYAHSYLLTAIVSPDYVDILGNGPDDTDLGNYTKFEYERAVNTGGTSGNYNWRIPYDLNSANFNENGKSIQNDDQGSFVYGEKELWFVKRVITKNYVAVFSLGDRHDALGVQDVNGGVGSNPVKSKYLKSVSLYARPEYDADTTPGKTNAVPIKVVHFVYDYSLCPGVPNNDGLPETVNSVNINAAKGKLTLKEVYFTYGKSDKAKFSKYQFGYGQNNSSGTQVSNFKYQPKAYDRWGNYMPVNNDPNNHITSGTVATPASAYTYTSPLNNAEFPYVDQWSKTEADYRASAWNLTSIQLPSGASIAVKYESDDYAFVQNRPAMQMMNVIDVTSSTSLSGLPTANSIGELYQKTGPLQFTNNLYVHFELSGPLNSSGTASDEIRYKYLKDINGDGKYLYFRFLANLTKRGTTLGRNEGDHFEYVSGYAEMDGAVPDCGLSGVNGPHGFPVAYIKLKDVRRDDKTSFGAGSTINPIVKAVLNFGKTRYNNVVWDASFSPPGDVISAVKQLASEARGGPIKTMMQAIKGPNNSLMDKEYGKEFVRNKSWIRLYNTTGRKFGGGSRVKELKIDDNWTSQTQDSNNPNGQASSVYGQEFTYETTFMGETISSGVASYEPMLGGDENPFRQPVFMGPNKFTMLVPDERFFMEEPFGESFFPSASVSYSKVKVKNRIPSGVNVKTHGTGYVVHEFYTAKDYPTITSHTPIYAKQYKPPLGGLLKVMSRDYMAATQGYVIKLNDMHGKQKAQSVYAEGSADPMSKVEYFYKTKGGDYTDYGLRDVHSDASCPPNELDNTCVVIEKDGTISSKTIGMDFDAVADFRETETKTVMGGAQINLSVFLVSIIPAAVPTVWPSYSFEKTRFRSAVMTKVISNYGVLEKTTAHDNGSSVTTSNLAYDAQTGDVLVTRTKNDFHDDIYSLKYPAFWGYDLMGPAYKNIGYSETVSFSAPGTFTVSRPDLFNIGDEITVPGTTPTVGWVCSISGSQISVISNAGNPAGTGTNVRVKVLRSGRRNLLSSQMASLTSLVNPVDYDNNGLDATLDVRTTGTKDYKVLNTSAIEYSDQWQTFKGYEVETTTCSSSLSAQGTAMSTFIQTLVANNKFQNPLTISGSPNFTGATVRTAGGVYNYGFSSSLYFPSYTPPGSNGLQWYFKPYPNNPTIANFGVGCDPACFNSPFENCGHIIATGPSGFDWNVSKIKTITSFSVDPTSCNPVIQVCGTYVTTTNSTPRPVCFTIQATGSCWVLTTVTSSVTTSLCGIGIGSKVNPFWYGIKGSWRPKTTWSYLEDRNQQAYTSLNNNVDIRHDGAIKDYKPFYDIPVSGGTWSVTTANINRWTYTSEITKHTPNGVEVENRDALGRYSSALYGYNASLPVAVASNAQLQEIAFDGVEDYGFYGLICNGASREHHFDFAKYPLNVTKQEAHTGKQSIKVNQLTSLSVSKKLMSAPCTTAVSPLCSYTLTCSDFIYPFTPITHQGSKKYILSYWVKEKETLASSGAVLTYLNSSIGLSVSGSGSVSMGTLKKSDIIDGWQRFEQDFTISSGASGRLNVTLVNTTNNITSYFDDIRIHPFNSNMKSFVYDPVTLKYVAELDANNFATFYEYDEEGSLVRVKKETEKGIMTIQETKNHTKR